MATPDQTSGDRLEAARAALDRGAWADARELFEAALEVEETPEAWEGLGWAAWWSDEAELVFEARERAFRAFREADDPGGAARVAAWLAADHREFRGEATVGRGWLERARRLIEDVPESPDHGWLALNEASFVLNVDADPAGAAPLSRFAARLGREHRVADLEAVGLAQEGIALVVQGDVDEGMRRLDEGSAIAAAEDLHLPLSRGWALCYMISACEGVGDFPRAAQWCEATREFTDRWGGRQMLGMCRTAYGRVLATRGDWPAADEELTAAIADMEAARPGMAGDGLARLGELRARQGRTDEARELFERAGASGLVGLGELALDGGDAAGAADAAQRVLRRLPGAGALARLPALELLARARAALGDWEASADAEAEVQESAARVGTAYMRGRARLLAAELAAMRGDGERAREASEDAVDDFEEVSAPYDAARARMQLARALSALGRDDAAVAEAGAAREAFSALGADRDAVRAGEPLRVAAAQEAKDRGLGNLTARELEVLRLVAQGHSDAEIAEQLVLSPHTVHRHVANVRTKLGLPSRAAAVAYAAREGLL